MSARVFRPSAAPVIAALLAFALFAWTLLQRASRLAIPAYDGAFFEQVVWNVGHGRGFTSGYFPASFLGLHFSPLLAVPAALELAWPDARLLSLLNAAALALAAPAAYLLLRALLGSINGAAVTSAALAAPLPFWIALQEADRAGFHTETLALPLVLIAGWAGLTGRAALCWVGALLTLAAKEDQAYAVLVIGLLLAFRGPSRAQGAALAVLAVAWAAVLELALMPALRGPVPSDLTSYYAWLHGAPASALAAAVVSESGWAAFAAMVLSMAGLPLLRPGWLALTLPPLLGDLLSAHYPQPELRLQYALPLVAPVLIAGGLGARSLIHACPALPAAGLAALAVPALVLGLAAGPLLLHRPAASGSPGALSRLSACATTLPQDVPLAAEAAAAAAHLGAPGRLGPGRPRRGPVRVRRPRLPPVLARGATWFGQAPGL